MESTLLALSRSFGRIPAVVLRHRWLTLAAFILVSAVMAWGAVTRLSIDMTLDRFIDQDDPAIEALNEFRSQFGSDDSIYLVYRARDGDVFSASSLEAVKTLTDKLRNWRELDPDNHTAEAGPVDLRQLEHIRRVRSLTTLRVQESEDDVLRSARLVPDPLPRDPEALAGLRERAMAEEDFLLAYYSPDGRYAALQIETTFGAEPTEDYVPAVDRDSVSLSDDFSAVDDPQGFDPGFNAEATVEDIPFQTVDMFDYHRFFTALRAVYSEHDEQLEFFPVGNPPLMDWVLRTLQEMIWLGLGMIAIFVTLLWVLFRSFSAVLWPILTVGLSLLWTVGAATWAGATLSTMFSLTCMLIFAVGIADCVHVMSAYFSRRREGQAHEQALAGAYEKTGLAILVTTLTTMAGVLALTSSDLPPIQVFGLMSALGVFLALLFTMTLLPLLLSLWHPGKPTERRRNAPAALRLWRELPLSGRGILSLAVAAAVLAALGPAAGGYILIITLLSYGVIRWQDTILRACPRIVQRSPLTVLGLFLGLFAVALYGTSQVHIDSNVSELTRQDSEPRRAYDVVDQHMAGAQSISIMIDARSTDALMQPEMLQTVDRLQQRIMQRYPDQVSRTFSLANIVKDTNQVMNNDDPEHHRIPDSDVMISQLLYLFNSANPEQRRRMVSDDYSRSHITINAYNAGSHQYQSFFRELGEEIDTVFAPLNQDFPEMQVNVTGSIPLMMRAMDEIAQSQYRSFLLALAVISVIMIATLGSLQAGLIAMVPNLIPALFTFGLMGLLNIPLDTDTLLIAPVIIGIAVDDTIHFMTHYRMELTRTASMTQALDSTIHNVGKAVMFTTMVLGLGFAMLSFSEYLGMAKIGFFGSLAVFVALLCDLFLLPAIMMVFKPRFGVRNANTSFSFQGGAA